jgi:acyl-CoA synthetase (AMP-forming)/AMP-acid ligase II
LIQYTIEKIIEKISLDQENLSIDSPIPIVISGGTSLPNGFLETFKRLFEENGSDFPYEISEIRR